MPVRSAIIPVLRYRDAPAAIDFLCSAFGFERHAVYPDSADPARIAHAELTRDDAMVMLSSDMPTDFAIAAGMRMPTDVGAVTQSIYVVLDDVNRHAATSRAAGAEIIMQPEDQPQGGRSYSVRDPEGHAWTFGSYDPLA